MPIPRFNRIMYPLLDTIKDKGEVYLREISDEVRDNYFNLTEEEKGVTMPNTGVNRFYYNLSWSKTYLKTAGLISCPQRGMLKITSAGLEILNKKREQQEITIDDLRSIPKYIEHENRRQIDREQEGEGLEEDLNNSPLEKMESGYEEILNELKISLLDRLKNSNPYYFEEVILRLFKKMGYGDYEPTKKSRDGGIDGIINQDILGIEKIYTQAKRYGGDVMVSEIDMRNFKGAIDDGEVVKGIFVTTSKFSDKAKKSAEASQNKIALIDGDRLVSLMIEYNLGVSVKDSFEIKEIDEDFFIE